MDFIEYNIVFRLFKMISMPHCAPTKHVRLVAIVFNWSKYNHPIKQKNQISLLCHPPWRHSSLSFVNYCNYFPLIFSNNFILFSNSEHSIRIIENYNFHPFIECDRLLPGVPTIAINCKGLLTGLLMHYLPDA